MAGVAAVLLVVLAATFAFVYSSTGSQLHAQIDRSIRGSALQLIRPAREAFLQEG